MQKNRKTIVLTEQTYEKLRNMSTITDSFDGIVRRLIEQVEAASGQQPLSGNAGQNAAAPLQPGGSNG